MVPFNITAVCTVLVTPMENIVPVATLRVLDTVKADVCKVIVPVEEAVKLFKVCPPPVMAAVELVIVTVEPVAVTVPPAMFKLPFTMWVAAAKVTVPERVRFWRVWELEVRVPEPDMTRVFFTGAVKVVFVRFTLPVTVQVPVPAKIVFVPAAEASRSPVMFTAGLLAAAVEVTEAPEARNVRPPEKVRVWLAPVPKVAVRPAVTPLLSIVTKPP